MFTQEQGEICELFADILEYPDIALPRTARNCALHLRELFPNLAKPVQKFAEFVNNQSLEALQELYTQTFDISPAASLYFGYHMFGETPKRSAFLVNLSEAYKACSLETGIELADHLGVMLRFISVSKDEDFTIPLINECILPTLKNTGKELKKIDSEYALVIEPLADFLQQISQQLVKTGGSPDA